MTDEHRIYRRLQRHLDAQPIGYPRMRGGADLRLLRRHFTPDEARLALGMTYRYETADAIAPRIPGGDVTIVQARALLEQLCAKGTVMRKIEEGVARYCLLPLVIGMYESRVFDLDTAYARDFDEYANALPHGLSFVSTAVNQMRVIPVGKSVTPGLAIMPYDDSARLIDENDGPIVVIDCICRKKRLVLGDPCKRTKRLEICMIFGDPARLLAANGQGRAISAAEARDIMDENQREGLVTQAYNMLKPEVLCACCGCCCGFLGAHRQLPNPRNFWHTNFRASIERRSCTRCLRCVGICQVGALSYNNRKKKVLVNRARCLGCGNCVPACPAGAVTLLPEKKIYTPPSGYQDLLETIMRNKPVWRLGRVILRTIFRRRRRIVDR